MDVILGGQWLFALPSYAVSNHKAMPGVVPERIFFVGVE